MHLPENLPGKTHRPTAVFDTDSGCIRSILENIFHNSCAEWKVCLPFGQMTATMIRKGNKEENGKWITEREEIRSFPTFPMNR